MEGSARKSSMRWRMGRAEIAKIAAPFDGWHPLDDGPAPEYVPPSEWDGPHVGLRLCDAFKTLSMMPNRGASPKLQPGFWPEYHYEWEDLLAQRQADVATQEDDASERNRTRVRPSAQEISRMEMAISWPGRYIVEAETARIVQRVALARSRDLDMSYVARKMRVGAEHVRVGDGLGLAAIAFGLHHDGVHVF
jgi:hypothetical protein